MREDTLKTVMTRFEQARAERSNWETLWQSAATYVSPETEFIIKKTPGHESHELVFNNTTSESADRLIGGLNSLLTNQSIMWFDYGVQGQNPGEAERRYLSEARDIAMDIARDPSLNLYASFDETYEQLVKFGTGPIYIDRVDGLTFRSVPLNSVYVDENRFGMVETVYRVLDLSARQAAEMFPINTLPEQVQDRLRSGSNLDEKEEYLHAIGPREDYDPRSMFATRKRFYSIFVHVKSQRLINEGGHDRFPWLIPRWRKVTGEKYGRSPTIKMLRDIRVMNAMSKAALSAAMKEVDPPVQVPNQGFMLPLKLGPSGVNYYRSSVRGRIEPIQTGARSDRAEAMIRIYEDRVKRGFYNDMFQMPEIDRMTATEVLQRQQEMRGIFSPTLTRLYSEMLDPVTAELYSFIRSSGLLPEPPDTLAGRTLRVYYISPLARAQRASEVGSFSEFIAALAPMAQLDPEVMDVVHRDRAARRLASALSVPESYLMTSQEMDTLRKARTEQAEQEQAIVEAQGIAGAAKDGAAAMSSLQGLI